MARPLLPTVAKTLGLSTLGGLASEGASQLVKAISGRGKPVKTKVPVKNESYYIPPERLELLLPTRDLLTKYQKEHVIEALQKGRQVILTPTKTQKGGALGTILASIGIPMAIDFVKNMISGKGAQRLGAPRSDGWGSHIPQRPPPFIGNWPNGQIGRGGALFDVGSSHSIGEMVFKGLANSGAYRARKGAAKAFKSDYDKNKIKQMLQ
ncbi:hypothetical protein AWC38_SpisGene9091 [Stylophora pistillata]|uniref:Uncharacterized protein n=1 Tax=Stylophora pistillata TaxID=50429 RepID=A0A2B4SA13_STYPI|nr:hypothetical protein AWC38_SpisGene9091 [Stylophora pistillata]